MVNYTELARGLEPFLVRLIRDIVGEQKTAAVKTGVDLNAILLFDTSLGNYKEFAISQAGFSAALASAGTGDVITVPPATITGAHTIADAVAVWGLSRYATIFSGQITGGAGASIENLSIIQSADSADNLVGVDSPASGTFYINGCDIEITQVGSGNAYGISADINNTLIEIWNSFVSGDSTGGTGYAGYRDTGTSATAHFYGGRALGSTNPFNV